MTELSRIDLPIAPRLGELCDLLAAKGALVLKAEPGAGKTSLVPLAIAGLGGGAGGMGGAAAAAMAGKVLVLEPRRVAAVQAAYRAAELLGEGLGKRVGYRVRGDSKPGTRIEFITEGVFVRMVQEDAALPGVASVIFDEFHERSVNADLGLALALEARAALRPELRILLMSATLDPARLAAFVGGGLLEVEGRGFPVETRYLGLAPGPRFEEGLAAAALGLYRGTAGDLLVFLPGAREIERTARALEAALGTGPSGSAGDGPRILSLHGSMPLEAQRQVILPEGAARRIILSTSVAETSLTVPRIAAVLDSGLARLSRFEARSGLNRLVTEREARDRADQRRGRAGRLGPGLCLRAFSEAEALPEMTAPEILRAELSSLVLEGALWGARRPEDLPWLDPPPQSAWEVARDLLIELGCVEASGAVTDFGRRAAGLGTEPRLAAMVLRGAAVGRAAEASALAALLAERGPAEADLDEALASMGRGHPAYARAREEARRLEAAARGGAGPGRMAAAGTAGRAATGRMEAAGKAAEASRGALLAAGFPDRVAKRVAKSGAEASFQLPGGRKLRATGSLAASEWIVVAEADGGMQGGGAEGKVFAGAALSEGEALAALAPLVKEEVSLEWEGLRAKARSRRTAGAILLSEAALAAPSREVLAAALAERIAARGLAVLSWGEAGERPATLLARMRWYRAVAAPEGWPELDDESLARTAGAWLGPMVESAAEVVSARGLAAALEALIPSGEKRRFDREAPASLELPSGRRVGLDYGSALGGPGGSPTGPILEAKPQELFGLAVQPRILGLPVVIRLLSPAGRPIHTTADLPGFWKGGWAELRKELRGRYPKHDWPEDPGQASASRKGLKGRA
jgi:ATP-dependent helicase HrpB